jgi:hypothetical protein
MVVRVGDGDGAEILIVQKDLVNRFRGCRDWEIPSLLVADD